MAIVSEAGQVTRTGKSKLRAVPKAREAKTTKASGSKPAKAGKEKDQPSVGTRCDLCGATDRPVRYHEGNACCEACAQKATPPTSSSAKPKVARTETPAPAEPKPLGASKMVSRSMASLVECYVTRMQADEKTPATIHGYRNDLEIAVRELGANTLVESLTPQRVAEYFMSDPVQLLRSGGAKSPLSVAKTQRVFRLALEHAAVLGWIAVAPIPDPAKS